MNTLPPPNPNETSAIADMVVELERLTAGADATPVEPGSWPTPAQYIHHWNQMTGDERLVEAEAVLELKRAEYYRLIQPPRHA